MAAATGTRPYGVAPFGPADVCDRHTGLKALVTGGSGFIGSNLVRALQYSKEVGAVICGVVGRSGGYTKEVADECVLIPVVNPATVTPHTESFQAVVWHLLVSHPELKASEMKWESTR